MEKQSSEEKEIQDWINEGLKKGYELSYLKEIVKVYKLEKRAYNVMKK